MRAFSLSKRKVCAKNQAVSPCRTNSLATSLAFSESPGHGESMEDPGFSTQRNAKAAKYGAEDLLKETEEGRKQLLERGKQCTQIKQHQTALQTSPSKCVSPTHCQAIRRDTKQSACQMNCFDNDALELAENRGGSRPLGTIPLLSRRWGAMRGLSSKYLE